jgi:hypothetical protein
MAKVVTAVPGDNISKLLSKRGVRPHETHTRVDRVRRLNPHIGNLDCIWPGDRILLPDSMMEMVSEQKVWENALIRIPTELNRPRIGNTVLYFTMPGDTIEAVAKTVFDYILTSISRRTNVSWVMKQHGYTPPQNAMRALSWMNFGKFVASVHPRL